MHQYLLIKRPGKTGEFVSHTEELQELLNRFSHACKEFGLMISIKRTKVMGQDVDNPPNVMIDDTPLDVMNTFTYLGTTIISNLSLDEEITTGIGKASATMARVSKWVWENRKLTLAHQDLHLTELAFSATCCTAVKHGQHMPIMKQDWTAFTSAT